MDVADVLHLLRDEIGSGVEITACSVLKEMHDYWVWDVSTEKPALRIIVKLSGPEASYTSAFERTAALHRLVRERTSIPMPEVIAADESYHKWPWRYFIKTFITGIEWASVENQAPPDHLDQALAQLGRAVAEIHQVTFDGFGELDSRPEIEMPLPYPEALARRIRKRIRSPEGRDFALDLLAAHKHLFSGPPLASLCHEDLHKYNLLLKKVEGIWQLASILDFEKAWAGDREIDLARMNLWKMARGPFWPDYLERCPLDPGYTEREPLYQLLWCIEFGKNTSEQLEITQRLCRTIGLPVIRSFRPFKTGV